MKIPLGLHIFSKNKTKYTQNDYDKEQSCRNDLVSSCFYTNYSEFYLKTMCFEYKYNFFQFYTFILRYNFYVLIGGNGSYD